MHEETVRIPNPGVQAVEVILEPWAEVHSVPPGQTLVIVANGPVGGHLEVKDDTGTKTVWAWPGSTARVFLEGAEPQLDATAPS